MADCPSPGSASISTPSVASGQPNLEPILHTLPPGIDRIVLGLNTHENGNDPDADVSMSYGGITMTLAVRAAEGASIAEIFYLLEDELPEEGDSECEAAGSGLAACISFSRVSQSEPFALPAQTERSSGDSISQPPFTPSADNSVVVSLAHSSGDASWPLTPTQTRLADLELFSVSGAIDEKRVTCATSEVEMKFSLSADVGRRALTTVVLVPAP